MIQLNVFSMKIFKFFWNKKKFSHCWRYHVKKNKLHKNCLPYISGGDVVARILLFGKKFESIYVQTHISGAFGMYLEARKTHNTINLIYCQSQKFNLKRKESRGR